jgi:hypothetical protein
MSSAKYVKEAAATIGLPIAPELLAPVVADFDRVGALAVLVMEFPLEQPIEPAPVPQP